MLKRCITSQTGWKPKKAAAPDQGAAAFFCSTGILLLEESLRYFSISQQQTQRGKPIVVLTEGQKRKPSIIQEVAA